MFNSQEHFIHFHRDQWLDIYFEGSAPDFVSMYKDIDAVTDVPPAFRFQEIYEAFPDAKVILSLRDNEDVWVQSWAKENELFLSLGGLLTRVLISWPLIITHRICGKRTGFELANEVLFAAFLSVNSKSTVLFKKKYREHNERVQAVIPKEKLLIYNVKQGWKPSCEFLGCDVPDLEFPRENVGLSTTRRRLSAITKRRKRGIFAILAIFGSLLAVYFFHLLFH